MPNFISGIFSKDGNNKQDGGDTTRFWQQVTCVACGLAGLSFILNITALALIGDLRAKTSASVEELKSGGENQQDYSKQLASEAWNNSTKIRKSLQNNIDQLQKQLRETVNDANQIRSKLDRTKTTVDWLEGKANKPWKRGCPQHGLTNGTLCFVLGRDRSNYTQAVANCKEKGGSLAEVSDSNVLEILTEAFATAPFFINAHYNKTTSSWKTSDDKDVDYLPWNQQYTESKGDCVYVYRSGYKEWHCKASLSYLCEF